MTSINGEQYSMTLLFKGNAPLLRLSPKLPLSIAIASLSSDTRSGLLAKVTMDSTILDLAPSIDDHLTQFQGH